MKRMVITGVGKDKPGIVAGLTDLLSACGANIEDSTMTLLAGEFAMIIIAAVPDQASLDNLSLRLPQLEQSLQIKLMVQPADDGAVQAAQPVGEQVMISVAGEDHTGITAKVTAVLAQHAVNITDLNAQRIPGEKGPVYIMMIEAVLPRTMTQTALQQLLQPLAADLNVEIRVQTIEVMTL